MLRKFVLIGSFLLLAFGMLSGSAFASPPAHAPGATGTRSPAPVLKSGFPISCAQNTSSFSGKSTTIVTGNIDSDPELEIMLGGLGNPGSVAAWNHDGTVAAGWPLAFGGSTYLAMGKLSNTAPALQVFASVSLAAFDGAGQVLPGWPRPMSNFSPYAPTLADVDGDGLDVTKHTCSL